MTRRTLRRADSAPSASLRTLQALLLAWLPLLLGACTSVEDDRIRQLLHERGFGTRADGNARAENFVAGGDEIQFLIDPNIYRLPGHEQLYLLTQTQPVAIDGTIYVPYVGPVYVLGKTEVELATLVRAQLRSVLKFEVEVQARIVRSYKVFYAVGEVGRKGRIQMEADLTLMDAMFLVNWTNLANLGRIYLIRPDAENPLVVDINFREMLTSGDMKPNVQIRERDIVYVPPTFLGLIARLLQRVLEPFGLAVRTMLGWADIRSAYNYLSGESDSYYRF